MKVALGDVVLTGLEPVKISGQEDPFSLAASLWLDDEGLCFPVIELLFEHFNVCRQEPCLREKIVVLWKVVLHRGKVLCQQVLSCQSIHAWKMICPLIAFHFDEECRYCGSIDEPKIPVFVLIYACSKIERRGNLMDKLILCVSDVDDERRITIRRFLAHNLLSSSFGR